MKKAVWSVMLVLLLSGAVVTAGAAQNQSVEINVARNGSYTIQEGDTVVIYSRWGACSRGLVRAGITAINWTVTLDGELLLTPDDVDELWGPVEVLDTPRGSGACVGNSQPAISYWRFELPELDVGEHLLLASLRLSHPVIDGGDYDGDGRPDLFTPEGLIHDTENTIIVEE